jgi:uncharacterized protein (TIGR03546 family)
MLLRHIGSMVRGHARPWQIMMATVLGALLGFTPGFSAAPGLAVTLGALVLLLNVSVPAVVLTFGLSKLLSLLLLPVSFKLGIVLVDGPLQGLFRWLINTPVLALFGFERYVTSGGLVLGLLFGLLVGWLIARAAGRLRTALAGVEVGSDAYRKLTDNKFARFVGWVFLGAKNLQFSAEAKRSSPVRLPGVILVLVFCGLAVALHSVLTGPLLTSALRRGLEQANGATVDLKTAQLDLTEGRLTIEGLALADASALERDVFRAGRLECDVDAGDLLRRRLALDAIIVTDSRHGALRDSPGKRVGPEPEPPAADTSTGGRTIEEWVRDAELWKERLAQVRRWLETFSEDAGAEAPAPGEPVATGPTLEESLEERARLSGEASVTADHLIEGAPTFLVRSLVVDGMISESLPGEVLDLRGENLSTQPALVQQPASLRVASRSGSVEARVGLGGGGASTEKGALLFKLRNWPVDSFASALDVGGQPPLAGGTLDLTLDGGWAGGQVGELDLPLDVGLRNTTLSLGGKSHKVSTFDLLLGLKGPLDNPAVILDEDGLTAALKAAGAAELNRRVDEEKAKAEAELEKKLSDKLGGLLGGDKKKKDG